MRWLGLKRQEYVSRFIGDIAKTIFAVGLASHLFRDFPDSLRIASGIACLVLALLSIWLHPKD